ncbi:hypothetical protein [Verrucomicrobium spinosum]|uniref:hypothetical protein n=1 Tax=Verrucomicrobium spinosum TaxID=2736 RepID=UPI0001746AA9|nr:hypothetical protein [Verrucomicrobium spinosum]
MKHLTESEFRATFAGSMQRVALDAEPPVPFWDYFDAIPTAHFAGHDCSVGSVSHAWTDATGRFQHVLVNTNDKNVFIVIVLDLRESSVFGHRLLNLNLQYGLEGT